MARKFYYDHDGEKLGPVSGQELLHLRAQGEIDGSVLKGVGELFLWPALAFGAKALDDNKKIQMQHGNTTITVGAHVPPPPPEGEVEDAEVEELVGEEEGE